MATVRNSDNLAADTKADEKGRECNSEGGVRRKSGVGVDSEGRREAE